MGILNEAYLLFFTRKIKTFKTKYFSVCFPNNWRKSISPRKAYVFFEGTKNYGFIIEEYYSKKITSEKILDLYEKKYSDCEIKTVEDSLNDNLVIKWAFDYEKVKVLEYKRLLKGDKIILDITYSIPNDLSNTDNAEAVSKLDYIMNSILLN